MGSPFMTAYFYLFVSNYVVSNRALYFKRSPSGSIYVAVVFTPNHPTDPDLREGLCQTMLLVPKGLFSTAPFLCFEFAQFKDAY